MASQSCGHPVECERRRTTPNEDGESTFCGWCEDRMAAWDDGTNRMGRWLEILRARGLSDLADELVLTL